MDKIIYPTFFEDKKVQVIHGIIIKLLIIAVQLILAQFLQNIAQRLSSLLMASVLHVRSEESGFH